MTAIPIFWTLDYEPSLLTGLPLPVAGEPTLLIRRVVVRALEEPVAPVWGVGANPFSTEADTFYGGRLSEYGGEILFDPPLENVLQSHLDLVSSFGFRQDARYQFTFGFPSDLPERWGFPGNLAMPDAWNTAELGTSLAVYLFPPDGGWCQRAVVRQPEVRKRVAVHRPERGAHQFDLHDLAGRFAYPTTSGTLNLDLEVNGTITQRTISLEVPASDETGGRLYQITPANGWAAPGWVGHIYRQADWALDWPFVQFEPPVELDLGNETAQSLRWRLWDHEGRSTPWVRYLVPPVAEIVADEPEDVAGEEGAEIPVYELETPVTLRCPGWDADGHLVRFDWSFGDGQAVSLPAPDGAEVVHTYLAEGDRVVRLAIYDHDGLTHETTQLIRIENSPAKLPALVGSDGIITMLRSVPGGVEAVCWQVPDGAGQGPAVYLWAAGKDPSLWRRPDGSLVALVRQGRDGPYRRWVSRDGGATWQ